MISRGQFHITLREGADEQAFLRHLDDVARSSDFLGPTRVTRGFEVEILRAEGDAPRYVLQVDADQMADRPYDFQGSEAWLNRAVGEFGAVDGLQTYTVVRPRG